MAKYGLFVRAGQNPIQEYEGDRMVQEGEYVKIYEGEEEDQVAAIRLEAGQSVRKLK